MGSRETTCPLRVTSDASETCKPIILHPVHVFRTWGAVCFCARFVARGRGQGGDQTTFAGADVPR